MAQQNITLLGASYTGVPAVALPKTGGGSATFFDVTDVTAAAADVATGKQIRDSSGVLVSGALTFQTYYTGSGAPSSSLGSDGDIYLQTS